MKYTILILSISVSLIANAQLVRVTKKDGQKITAKVTGIGGRSMGTTQGTLSYDDMDSVVFDDDKDEYRNLMIILSNSNVKIAFKKIELDPIEPQPSIDESKFKDDLLRQSFDSLELRINSFRRDRTTAKVFQLTAILCTASALLLASQKNPDLDTIKGLSVAGAVVFTIGIGLDIEAGSRLKKPRH